MEQITNTEATFRIARALLLTGRRPVNPETIERSGYAASVVELYESNFHTSSFGWKKSPAALDVKKLLADMYLQAGLKTLPAPPQATPYSELPEAQPQYAVERIPDRAFIGESQSARMPRGTIYCTHCGTSNPRAGDSCSRCGRNLVEQA